jgi:hypothetical protein
MAMSDCPKCWETPCVCGHEYKNWKPERREALAKVLLQEGPRPSDVYYATRVAAEAIEVLLGTLSSGDTKFILNASVKQQIIVKALENVRS